MWLEVKVQTEDDAKPELHTERQSQGAVNIYCEMAEQCELRSIIVSCRHTMDRLSFRF